jgi:DNA polymerase/3'-5' exonuclease PolX
MTIKQRLETLKTKEEKLEYLDQQITNLTTNLSICISMGRYKRIHEIYQDIDTVKQMRKEIETGEHYD